MGSNLATSAMLLAAAAVGLLSGTLLLGERYAAATWAGALGTVAGVALVTLAQEEPRERASG